MNNSKSKYPSAVILKKADSIFFIDKIHVNNFPHSKHSHSFYLLIIHQEASYYEAEKVLISLQTSPSYFLHTLIWKVKGQ